MAANNGYTRKIIDIVLYKIVTNKPFTFCFEQGKNETTLLHNVRRKSDNNISKFIQNNKSTKEKGTKSDVYKLSCKSCTEIYVGQTYSNHIIQEFNIFSQYYITF